MSAEGYAALGVIVSALLGFAGIAYTQWSGRRSTDQARDADRLDKLEKDVEQLRSEINTLDAVARAFSIFVDRIGFWVERGAKPEERPRPPEVIRAYIDMTPWS